MTVAEDAVKAAEMLVGHCKTKKERKELLEWAKYIQKELDKAGMR